MQEGITYLQKIVTSILGLLCIIVACFLMLSFISYTPIDVYSTNEGVVFNQAGRIGSTFADVFLQYFGISAVLLPFFLLIWGLILFYKHKLTKVPSKILFGMASIIGSSFLLGKLHNIENMFSFLIGGYYGWMLNSIVENSIFHIPLYIALLIVIPFMITYISGLYELSSPKVLQKFIEFIRNKLQMYNSQHERKKVFAVNTVDGAVSSNKYTSSDKPTLSKDVVKKSVNKSVKNVVQHVPLQHKGYVPPEVSFLMKSSGVNHKIQEENNKQAKLIQEKLKQVLLDFGIKGQIMSFSVGPVITMYEFEPQAGVRSARVIGLADDIARSLKAKSARIGTIPGRSSLAIEIPNTEREIVYLRELIESNSYYDDKHILPLCLGKDISGKSIIVDLAKMPHLLVAGTTGSGKSIGINSMIMSILYRLSPDECKLIMIDPKMLELSVYEGIPHLMTPVVTDPEKAALTLQWVTKEMEKRYKAMSKIGVRNIFNYNSYIKEMADGNVVDSQHEESESESDNYENKKMPYIVVIVDEMADLMLTAGKTVEASIQRLAQMARAAGIHIIMATQRPSVDVITGIIKANFPTRISFQVTSKIDSRTILGYQGAEGLLGKGDMLYMPTGGKTYRVHGPFVDDKEVAKVVNYLKQNYPNTNSDYGKILLEIEKPSDDVDSKIGVKVNAKESDDLYQQAITIVQTEKRASISYVQRRLRIGYNKAANFIEQMEKDGIVSAPDNSGKRIVIEEG